MGPVISQQPHEAGADTVSNPVPTLSFKQHHTLSVHICYHLPLPGAGPAVLQSNTIRDVVQAPVQMKAADSLSYRLAAFTQGTRFPPAELPPLFPAPAAHAAHQRRQEASGSLCSPPTGDFSPIFRKDRGGRQYQTLKTLW